MKTLALETSGTGGSIALWTGEFKVDPTEWTLPSDVRSARSLAPAIERALGEFGWRASEIELVAVTIGPGSFTGLRVGVVTAKTFAFAVGCPVVGINTLEVIARQCVPDTTPAWVVMDAQRNELFAAKWRYRMFAYPSPYGELQPTTIMAIDEWLAVLQPGDWVTGPALTRLADQVPSHANIVEAQHWNPQASTVAWASREADIEDRAALDPFALTPKYFRRTAAEEQWEKRRSQST